ncbi:MAG: hypothetical protein Q7K43_02890 [Candidatus Woesearchaeota archaeon]|nr:hypothetical protein [Candidatus Woesearchaeota archaeon]
MKNISNKTIVSLLTIIMVVTVVGTIFSVNKLEEFVGRFAVITGAATSGTGYVNLTAASNNAITVAGNVDLGSGYVNVNVTAANISTDTNFTAGSSGLTGWFNTTPAWSANGSTNITINNTGNTIVNLTFASNQSVASWLGGTIPDVRIKGVPGDSFPGANDSCTGTWYATTLTTANYSMQVNATTQNLCTSATQGLGFDFLDTSDEIKVYFNLLLPRNLASGQRSTTLTFTSTANQ